MYLPTKIQTTIVIALVFVFRLFYSGVCVSEAQQNTKTTQFISSHFKSVLKKRRRAPETIVSNKTETNSGQDFFEEIPDNEEEPIKGDNAVVLSYLYMPSATQAGSSDPEYHSGDQKHSLLSKKYLAFSILRI